MHENELDSPAHAAAIAREEAKEQIRALFKNRVRPLSVRVPRRAFEHLVENGQKFIETRHALEDLPEVGFAQVAGDPNDYVSSLSIRVPLRTDDAATTTKVDPGPSGWIGTLRRWQTFGPSDLPCAICGKLAPPTWFAGLPSHPYSAYGTSGTAEPPVLLPELFCQTCSLEESRGEGYDVTEATIALWRDMSATRARVQRSASDQASRSGAG